MERTERLKTLNRWWLEKNKTDYDRARNTGIRETDISTEEEKRWYNIHRQIALVILEHESKKRWAVSNPTAKDYSETVLGGVDGTLRVLAKLSAREMGLR